MPTRPLRHPALPAALAAATLAACAPPMAMPPPLPLASAPTDLGVSLGVGLSPGAGGQGGLTTTVDAQAWVILGREGAACQAGALIFAGRPGDGLREDGAHVMAGAGEVLRCDLAPTERWYVGPQAEIGWFWAGLGLPVGYLARPDLLIYTTPTFRLVSGQPVFLPVGVAWQAEDEAWIMVEAGFRGGPNGIPLQSHGYVDAEIGYISVGARL